MEQSFELRLGRTQALEKGPRVHPVEAPEHREAREQTLVVDSAKSERAVEQARSTLAAAAIQKHVETIGANVTTERVLNHLEAVQQNYGIASIILQKL